MRMIDKDDVISMIDANIDTHADNQWDSGYNTALAEMKNRIAQMPTIEAEHVNAEKGNPESEQYCYDCIHNEVCRYCPHNGCDFKEISEPMKHGRWIMREKDKLIQTGKFAVSEGHILHKTSADKPFNLQSANIIPIKEHKKVKIPYCPICGNYGDDEYDRTPFCSYCGTEMESDSE